MDGADNGMPSTSNQNNNMDFSDENEIDLCNLVDSDEPELRQLDDNEDKPEKVVKADELSVLLSDYGDDGIKLAENLRLFKIEYKDLSSLSDSDLRQFGILSGEKRQRMLNDFSELLNQNEDYDKELSSTNIKDYTFEGLDNIRKHLTYLRCAISTSLYKLHLQPAEDVYVNNDLNASELVLRTLEEMKRASNLMEMQLSKLSTNKNELKTSKYSKCWKLLLLLGATAVSSAVFYKYYRTKLFKV